MRYFKRLSCRPVNVIASALIAFTTGCESIRAIIDYETACGNGPNAEEAVVRLTDEADLRRVIVNGQNEKARIAAMKKSTDEQLFELFVCSAEASPDMRLMAFQRLVELGLRTDWLRRIPISRMSCSRAVSVTGFARDMRALPAREGPCHLTIFRRRVFPSPIASRSLPLKRAVPHVKA